MQVHESVYEKVFLKHAGRCIFRRFVNYYFMYILCVVLSYVNWIAIYLYKLNAGVLCTMDILKTKKSSRLHHNQPVAVKKRVPKGTDQVCLCAVSRSSFCLSSKL